VRPPAEVTSREPLPGANIPRLGAMLVLLASLAAQATRAAPQAPAQPPGSRATFAAELRTQEADVLATRARRLLAAGAYAEARALLLKATRLDPGNQTHRRLLAAAEQALGLHTSGNLLARARQSLAYKSQALSRQAELDLFEGQRALEQGDCQTAAQMAERVLSSVGYILDASQAARLRAAAERLRDQAARSEQQALEEKRQARLQRALAEAQARRQTQLAARTQTLHTLAKQGRDLLAAGKLDEALAVADRIMKLDPGNPEARSLRQEAHARRLATPNLAGRSPERRKAEDDLLKELEKEFTPPKPGVVVTPGPKKPKRAALGKQMEPWERELRARLAEEVKVEFRQTPVRDAIEQLAGVGGINIIIDPGVDVEGKTVTLPPAPMPLESVIGWVAYLSGLRSSLRDGAVFLTTPTSSGEQPVTRTYNISTLLTSPMTSEPLSASGPVEPGPRPTEPTEQPGANPDAVGQGWAEFIRATVAPGTWGAADALQQQSPYSIQYRNGRIVVVHTPEVQKQVAELLDSFRKARNLQVHIEARYIQIEKRFLDQLSISFLYGSGTKWLDQNYSATMSPATEVAAMPRFDGYAPMGGLSLRYGRVSDDSLAVLLQAVLHQGRGTVLQAPRLTCFNTQRANIQIVRNHNYIRRVSSDFVPEIGNVPEGIIFDVQPFVSADHRYITLVFQPQMRELVSIVPFTYGVQTVQLTENTSAIVPITIQLPTTRLRSVGTTVSVPNGGTVMLGGFSEVEEHSGVATMPFVEGIPVLRHILRGWDRRDARKSLIMLVSAQTIEDIFEEEE